MHRTKGTRNTPQGVTDEIIRKHESGISTRGLAEEYGKPYKTIRNMITQENNKKNGELNPWECHENSEAASLRLPLPLSSYCFF